MPDPSPGRAAVSNSQFLSELARAAPNGSALWVTAFGGSPDLTEASNWSGGPFAGRAAVVDAWGDRNAYYSVAALVPTADGQVRRRKANFGRLLALVADDVLLDDVRGGVSYVLETSPGKTQVGILIDSADPDAANGGLVDAVMSALAVRGMVKADTAGNNSVRYVRLPVGTNQKPRTSGPWSHRLTVWRPEVRLSLADAVGAFGLDLDALRHAVLAKPEAPRVEQGEKLRTLARNIIAGEDLHDSLAEMAASMAASSMPAGAIVNLLRGLMDASAAPRDERYSARYADIPRAVSTATQKYLRPVAMPMLEGGGVESLRKIRPAKIDLTRLAPIKWAITGFIAAGDVVVFAGQPGVGKSTVFSGLALLVAGFGTDMGSDIEIDRPRRVLIVSEHSSQYERLLYGYCTRFGLSPAAVSDRVRLFDAARCAVSEIEVEILSLIAGVSDEEPPLVLLDTASASFDLADENSNAEVGGMLAQIKKPVAATGAPLWIVAHAAKALGREDSEITPRGASAYIGDVQATGSVFRDKNFPDSTFVKSLKNRNERLFTEIECRTEVAWHEVVDERGVIQQIGIRTCLPMVSGEAARADLAARARAAEKAAKNFCRAQELRTAVIEWMRSTGNKPASGNEIAGGVGGNRTAILNAVKAMKEAGDLEPAGTTGKVRLK